ncbi:uncharacterized protein LOC113065577 isoform X2 [Carassius auratus]|nr:uncharacterized protein LOC113065577 isoform X2 [Carassius auratus]XP_026092713.1 uncharacterized protein LOC113065577 isoform X2 [Carassius auratus]XP_026092714.1 uncharacterized protein LOC113065577 isoform X2 [Carassius auratus]
MSMWLEQLVSSSGTMQLNRAFAFLCLVISVDAQRSHRMTCYLDVLTHRTHEGPCSHIILPLTSTDGDLYLQSLSEDDSVTLRSMKERNPALKILLGLEVRSSRLELMSANEASIENFVQTLLKYLKDKSLDGLDVTWLDGPTFDESSRNKELITNFLKILKGAFKKETQPLLLSVSVLGPVDHSDDEQTLSQYVDFISILPAQLKKDGPYMHWQDQHVDLQKFSLAMPAFLRRSRRRHHHRDHFNHEDMNTETGKKDHIHVLGFYLGDRVCQAIKSRPEKFITLTSFSDEQSLVAEVLQKGFGGITVVFIDLDVFYNSICAHLTQDERAIVESKVVLHSHHVHRRQKHGGHHHSRNHHHSRHHHHHSLLPYGSHGHHHHGHHQHGHGHHHHHHHHHLQIIPQRNITVEERDDVK